jgi:hypothetical protein
MFVDADKYAQLTGIAFGSIMTSAIFQGMASSYNYQHVVSVMNECEILYMGFEVEDLSKFRPLSFIAYKTERTTVSLPYSDMPEEGAKEVEKASVAIEMCFTLPRMKVSLHKKSGKSQLDFPPKLKEGEVAPITPAEAQVDGEFVHLYLPGGNGGNIVSKMIELFIRRDVYYRSSITHFSLNYQDRTNFRWLYGAGVSNGFDEVPGVSGASSLVIYNNIFNTRPVVAYDGVIEELLTKDETILATEKGMFEASPAYIELHGGQLAKAFLAKLRAIVTDEDEYTNLVIRFGVVRLHEDQYANVPGYHGDFPDTDAEGNIRINTTIDGEMASHYLVTSAEPTTEFVTAENVYLLGVTKKWSELMRSPTIDKIEADPSNLKSFAPGQVVRMSGNTIHRVPMNTNPGLTWRVIGRASSYAKGHSRRPAAGVDHATRGSIQVQTQVYGNINHWQ